MSGTFSGGAGNDTLYGNAGNDNLNGGPGDDDNYGDDGDDTTNDDQGTNDNDEGAGNGVTNGVPTFHAPSIDTWKFVPVDLGGPPISSVSWDVSFNDSDVGDTLTFSVSSCRGTRCELRK